MSTAIPERIDANHFLRRLEAAAKRRPPEPEPTPKERRIARVRERDERLSSAGYHREEDRLIVARALEKPPVIRDHAGNVAAYEAVWRWLRSPSVVALTMIGPTGTGKSLAAAWAIADTERAYWLQADDAEFDRQRWEAIRERAITASVCVINDLGDEDRWASRRLAAVIRRRVDDGRRIIVTTNLPMWSRDVPPGMPADRCIQARYDDRVADRLGRGRVIVAQCGGESLRGRAA